MRKFKKVVVVLKDERTGKELRLEAQSFAIDGFCEPRSGVFLDAIVCYSGMKVRQSATIMKPYWLEGAEDAASTAKLVIADFLQHLASLTKSLRLPPELDRNAEWRIYIQSRTYHLYHAAQQCTFPLDLLEEAAEFGQYCLLLHFVFLHFLAGHEHCYADRLGVVAEKLNGEKIRSLVVRL